MKTLRTKSGHEFPVKLEIEGLKTAIADTSILHENRRKIYLFDTSGVDIIAEITPQKTAVNGNHANYIYFTIAEIAENFNWYWTNLNQD